jgi:hypothetical protein
VDVRLPLSALSTNFKMPTAGMEASSQLLAITVMSATRELVAMVV